MPSPTNLKLDLSHDFTPTFSLSQSSNFGRDKGVRDSGLIFFQKCDSGRAFLMDLDKLVGCSPTL